MAPPVSKPAVRLEGRAKVTGASMYTGDFDTDTITPYLHSGETAKPVLHALAVQSTIAAGSIVAVHTDDALKVSGVRMVMTHRNAPRLHKVKSLMSSELSKWLPLQKDEICYHGQPVALVIADALESARLAASLIQIEYNPAEAFIDFDKNIHRAQDEKKVGAGDPGEEKRGDPDKAFRDAEVQIDCEYITCAAHHNTMEPAASLAHWHAPGKDAVRLTVISSSQFVYGDAIALGGAFKLGVKDSLLRLGAQVLAGYEFDSKVRVIAPLIGGGFGSKGGNSHLLLAAMAAKACAQPVKLVLERPQTFAMMPYRSAGKQRIKIGSDRTGRIAVLHQHAVNQNAQTSSFIEPFGEATPHLYDIPNLHIRHKSLRLNLNSPGWMRAPGIAPAQFAIESALDELAVALDLDPIEVRLRNYAEVDPATGHPWSSKSLRECYAAGAESIGWQYRPKHPASLREVDEHIGLGMATAFYPTNQFPSAARITLFADGTALAQSSAQEVGQGAITSLTQIAADVLGIAAEKMRIEIGDTVLPMGFVAGGSSTTLSIGMALEEAAKKLRPQIFGIAVRDKKSPLYNAYKDHLEIRDGMVRDRTNPLQQDSIADILSRNGKKLIAAKGVAGRRFGKSQFGRAAFGAQFARVAVNTHTKNIRVTHMSGAFAAGRIVNPLTARSQLMGGMVWGIGHALMEQTTLDLNYGAWVNSNLGEAHVPANADVPDIQVMMIDEDDTKGSALGIKGIGEIGITGVAAAIANAVYNATGKRVRSLPLTLDKLL